MITMIKFTMLKTTLEIEEETCSINFEFDVSKPVARVLKIVSKADPSILQ